MATANELFRDALIRRQVNLQRFSGTLAADIVRLLDSVSADLRQLLVERLASIVELDFGPSTTSRLRVLEGAIEKIRRDAFSGAASMWDEQMRALAKSEVAFLREALDDFSPVRLDTVLPTASQLGAIVSQQPFEGKVLRDWASNMADADLERIMSSIRIGMAQGENTQSIVRRIVGTSEFGGSDGVLQIARNDAFAITKTAVNHVANAASQAWVEANDDVFTEEAYVATLDARTTPECRALDGQVFPVGKGPKPPIHFGCRSRRIPIIGGSLIGNRPATKATENALKGLSKTERAAKIKELTGQVPAATNYQQWLSSQSAAFQDEVLGPERAALFREGGLTLDRFVSKSGDQFTLDQLRKREPRAFRRAGV